MIACVVRVRVRGGDDSKQKLRRFVPSFLDVSRIFWASDEMVVLGEFRLRESRSLVSELGSSDT